jgi:hypothetical protein
MKLCLGGTKSRVDTLEEKTSELEDMVIKTL